MVYHYSIHGDVLSLAECAFLLPSPGKQEAAETDGNHDVPWEEWSGLQDTTTND